MNQEIERIVQTCSTCQKYRNAQSKETLICHEIPEKPFEKVGADLFHFAKNNYLLVVDYTTKFFECTMLTETTSNAVVTAMKSIFFKAWDTKSPNDRQRTSVYTKRFQVLFKQVGIQAYHLKPALPIIEWHDRKDRSNSKEFAEEVKGK